MSTENARTGNPRAGIARAITHIIRNNRTIDWVLQERPKLAPDPAAVNILYGVFRHFYSLSHSIDQHLKKPLRNKDHDVYALMLVGAYQLAEGGQAAYAVINETVVGCDDLRKPWAKDLVNAVLRQWKQPKRTFEHPQWLIERLQSQYTEVAGHLINANNDRAPMTLRVNRCRISVADYAQSLQQQHVAYRHGPVAASITLQQPQPSATLPGWADGSVAVQDLGAQMVADALFASLDTAGATTNKAFARQILDACAAPGGKLAHLYEALADTAEGQAFTLTGLDHSDQRLEQTRRILTRLGHLPQRLSSNASSNTSGPALELLAGDATQRDWWSGNPFDCILLDAPCSGTGTIRRHPEIKVLLNPAQVSELAGVQRRMLNNLWQTLAPGGTLWYCTCSLLEEENDDVISDFLDTHANQASHLPMALPSGAATRHGWQTLPTDPDTDGFYLSVLQKGAPAVPNKEVSP